MKMIDQKDIQIGTHGEKYGNWMSNPFLGMIGGIAEKRKWNLPSHDAAAGSKCIVSDLAEEDHYGII